MPPPPSLRLLAGIAATYAVCGIVSLHMAIPPGYIAPLFPAAGVAFAGMLIYGPRIWPAVFAGSLITNIEAVLRSGWDGPAWIVPLCVGVGAVLQALAGAALARRWVGLPNALDSAGAIVRLLFVAAPISCLISASVGISALRLVGSLPASEASFSWWNWWAGDSIGILIATPLAFALIGRPRSDWAPRRLAIALPLSIGLVILVGVETRVAEWERQRLQSRFEHDARHLSSLIRTRLAVYLDVLQATERLMIAAPTLDRDGFAQFAASWRPRIGGIQAIGWMGHPASDEAAPQLVHLDAPASNLEGAAHSLPGAAEAIARTRAGGSPAATRAFRLGAEADSPLLVAIYQHPSANDAARATVPKGLAFVALRVEDAIGSALKGDLIAGIGYCLAEIAGDPPAGQRIAGLAVCPEALQPGAGGILPWQESFDFAGRNWQLSFAPDPAYAPLHRGWEAWTLIAVGLVSIGLLGAFLLATSGRARRVEELVRLRTGELADAGLRLQAKQAILTHAERIARLGSWEADPASGSGHWSAELHRILGIPPERGGHLAALLDAVHPDDRAALQDALRHAGVNQACTDLDIRLPATAGRERILHFTLEPTRHTDGTALLRGTVQDVTASRSAEAHIHYLAHFDPLTGLPNRMRWMSLAEQALAFARRNQLRLGVLFLDLDNFKTINDTLGHPVGDRLLSAVATRLSGTLRDEDVLARLGGDEFVVLLPELAHADDAAIVARKLTASLSLPFDIDDQELTVSTSIGISLYPGNGADVATLLKHADTAMYDAKGSGRNDFRFFTPDMNRRAFARLKLESALRRALERGELFLEYQPQWEMPARRLSGVEALVRWHHPEHGRVPPGEFIPVAEESGLIHALGDWVLDTACRQQAAWLAEGLASPTVAVNISALQFRKAGFIDRARRIIADSGASPAHIELELTESALMQPTPEIEAQLATLRGMGIGLALDDFGTGYSSLAYLKRLPLTHIKIDRSFVQDLPGDTEDAAIATATLSIARDLGLTVVAEGVETEAQRDFLLERQCRVMQGFLLARPLPAAEISALLRETPRTD